MLELPLTQLGGVDDSPGRGVSVGVETVVTGNGVIFRGLGVLVGVVTTGKGLRMAGAPVGNSGVNCDTHRGPAGMLTH